MKGRPRRPSVRDLCERAPFAVNRAESRTWFLPVPSRLPIDTAMAEPPAADRIDAALARIEAAIATRAASAEALARRHAALKARMAEAVAALDDVIVKGQGA